MPELFLHICGVESRDGVLRGANFLRGTILNFPVFVLGELRVHWFGVTVFQKNSVNVPLHGKSALEMRAFSSIRPSKVNTCKTSHLPICGDGAIFLEGVEQVLGVAFTNILNPKVVNYDPEQDWEPFMAPESWSCGGFIITGFVKTDAEKILC